MKNDIFRCFENRRDRYLIERSLFNQILVPQIPPLIAFCWFLASGRLAFDSCMVVHKKSI